MKLAVLSSTLTVDLDKVIGIRDTDDPERKIILLSGSESLSVSRSEASALRSYSTDIELSSMKLQSEYSKVIKKCLDQYFLTSAPRRVPLESAFNPEGRDPKVEKQEALRLDILSCFSFDERELLRKLEGELEEHRLARMLADDPKACAMKYNELDRIAMGNIHKLLSLRFEGRNLEVAYKLLVKQS